jgi:tripartite-type tricarboxylate transporter receptor subunit TctC
MRLGFLLLALGAALAQGAHAQPDPAAQYPQRTIRIVVSSAPGGGPDIVSRILSEKLQKRWAQPVIVENRPGGGGNLGAEIVSAAEPDGYTLLAAQPAPLTTNAVLYRKLNFDPAALEPVVVMTAIPNVLVVRAGFPATSVAQLIAYAKTTPGKVTYGSQGLGTTPHLTAELFSRLTGTSLTHVPYRGTAQAVNDLLAGHLDMLFMQLDAVREHIESGRIKVLAVTGRERLPSLPDTPTLAEAGTADLISDTWNALAAPPKTPKPVIAKLNGAINEVFALADVREHMGRMSMRVVGGSPEAMAAFLAGERARWGEVIRAAKLNAD